jgi:hypothetical protein
MGSSPRYEYYEPGSYYIPPPSTSRRPPFGGAYGGLGGLGLHTPAAAAPRAVRVEVRRPRQSIVNTFFGAIMVNPRRRRVEVSIPF